MMLAQTRVAGHAGHLKRTISLQTPEEPFAKWHEKRPQTGTIDRLCSEQDHSLNFAVLESCGRRQPRKALIVCRGMVPARALF